MPPAEAERRGLAETLEATAETAGDAALGLVARRYLPTILAALQADHPPVAGRGGLESDGEATTCDVPSPVQGGGIRPRAPDLSERAHPRAAGASNARSGAPGDGGTIARTDDEVERHRAVTEALRTLYGYGPGRFPHMSPPPIVTWGVAQMRMRRVLADAALRPALRSDRPALVDGDGGALRDGLLPDGRTPAGSEPAAGDPSRTGATP